MFHVALVSGGQGGRGGGLKLRAVVERGQGRCCPRCPTRRGMAMGEVECCESPQMLVAGQSRFAVHRTSCIERALWNPRAEPGVRTTAARTCAAQAQCFAPTFEASRTRRRSDDWPGFPRVRTPARASAPRSTSSETRARSDPEKLGWSQRWDLNPQPQLYESCALPLSYSGVLTRGERTAKCRLRSARGSRDPGRNRPKPCFRESADRSNAGDGRTAGGDSRP